MRTFSPMPSLPNRHGAIGGALICMVIISERTSDRIGV